MKVLTSTFLLEFSDMYYLKKNIDNGYLGIECNSHFEVFFFLFLCIKNSNQCSLINL